MALDVKAGVAATVTSCGVEIHPTLFVWFYNVTASSVLLVAIFHASFDGAIHQPSYDIVPASNEVRLLIFSVVIMLAATTLIIATKGSSAEPRKLLTFMPVSLTQNHD